MNTLNEQKQNTDCPYRIVESAEHRAKNNIILPLSLYQIYAEELSDRLDVGLFLDSDQEVQDIKGYLSRIPIILLNFPHFSDGRAYSKAVQLRQEYKFGGEIRAHGDVRLDQLLEMQRCGFDSYTLGSADVDYFLTKGAKRFSYPYQTSILDPEPLFRIRTP